MVTATEYRTLQDAYDYFNEALFNRELPQVLITLQHQSRALGYFSANRFQKRGAAHNAAAEANCEAWDARLGANEIAP